MARGSAPVAYHRRMVDPSPPAPRAPVPDTGHGAARCWSCGAATGGTQPCPRCGAEGPAPAAMRGAVGFLARIGKGAAAPLRGLAFLNKHPRLWSFIALPLLLNLIVCVLAFWFLLGWIGDWMPDLSQQWPAWIDWARSALGWLLEVVLWAVSLLAAAISALALSGVVNSFFYDLLSEKVEAAHFGRPDPGRPLSALLGDILRGLRASISLLVRYALVMIVLLALSFTAVGAPLLVVAGFYYAGLAQIDLTMARKLYPGSRRTGWARRHLPLVLGLGVPVSFLPLVMPFGVVGATLAFLEEPAK